MARFNAFIFDLDGTLVRIPTDWQRVRLELKAALKTDDSFSPLFGSLSRLLREKPEASERIFAILDRHEMGAIPGSSLIEGAEETLSKLSDGAILALVTMQGKKACEAVLTRFSLARFFRESLTREDSLERSQQLRTVTERLNVKREEALFIGDRLNDVRSAQEVGVAVALVGEKSTAEFDPNYRFSNMMEFRRFILDQRSRHSVKS